MGALDPDEYQELLNAHDELDNTPVHLTRYQAQKCAAILTAGQDGHATYAKAECDARVIEQPEVQQSQVRDRTVGKQGFARCPGPGHLR